MNTNIIQSINDAIEKELDNIHNEAHEAAKLFWMMRDRCLENNVTEKKPRIGCRVQVEKNSISMNWFYYEFYRNPRTKKTQRTNVRINKPKTSFTYSFTKLLKYSVPSLDEAVIYTEKKFSHLRERLEKIRKLKIWLHSYEKTIGSKGANLESSTGESLEEKE